METSVKNGQSSILTKNIVVCGIALLCTFLWGSAFPSIKVGYRLFSIADNDTASQMLFAGYRFTLAGILTLIIGWISNRRFPIPKKQIRKNILILGLLQTTFQYLFFSAFCCRTASSVFRTLLIPPMDDSRVSSKSGKLLCRFCKTRFSAGLSG